MTWKPIASVALSVASICTQFVGLSCASSGAITVARGGQVNRNLSSAAGAASALAIVLALLALTVAVISWPREPRWARVSALCLALGALLWSLVMV
jgi:hypothetical protein